MSLGAFRNDSFNLASCLTLLSSFSHPDQRLNHISIGWSSQSLQMSSHRTSHRTSHLLGLLREFHREQAIWCHLKFESDIIMFLCFFLCSHTERIQRHRVCVRDSSSSSRLNPMWVSQKVVKAELHIDASRKRCLQRRQYKYCTQYMHYTHSTSTALGCSESITVLVLYTQECFYSLCFILITV